MEDITWNKRRIGVHTCWDNNVALVWLSDDGTHWRDNANGLYWSVEETLKGCTITPLEDWAPPIEDGVWLRESPLGAPPSAYRVVDGKVINNSGGDISDIRTPARYICPIPEWWSVTSE